MKATHHSARRRITRVSTAGRAKLLAAFDRSGSSAAQFARQHGLRYSTFCGWRYRRAKEARLPGFVQVQLPSPTRPAPLVIELGHLARLRIDSTDAIDLAARLLQRLNGPTPC